MLGRRGLAQICHSIGGHDAGGRTGCCYWFDGSRGGLYRSRSRYLNRSVDSSNHLTDNDFLSDGDREFDLAGLRSVEYLVHFIGLELDHFLVSVHERSGRLDDPADGGL